MVRNCEERVAKCEIKSKHLEKLNNKVCCIKTQVLNIIVGVMVLLLSLLLIII